MCGQLVAGGLSTKDHPADLGRSKIHRRWGHGWCSVNRDGSKPIAIWCHMIVGITSYTNELFYGRAPGFWSTTEDSLLSATGDLWWDSLSRSQGLGPSRWRNVSAMEVKWQARRIAMLFTSLHKCWLKNCWQYDQYLILSSWHDGQWLLCVECSIVWCCAARILTTWKRSRNGHWYSLIAFVRSSMRSEWKDNMKSIEICA